MVLALFYISNYVQRHITRYKSLHDHHNSLCLLISNQGQLRSTSKLLVVLYNRWFWLDLKPLLEIKCNSCRKNNLLSLPFLYPLFAVHMECPLRVKLGCIHDKRDHHLYNRNLSIDKMILNWIQLFLHRRAPAVNKSLVSKILFLTKTLIIYISYKSCLHRKARRKLQNDHHNNLQRECNWYRKNSRVVVVSELKLAVDRTVFPYLTVLDDNRSIAGQLLGSNLKLNKEIRLFSLGLQMYLILHSSRDIEALHFVIKVLLFCLVYFLLFKTGILKTEIPPFRKRWSDSFFII